MATHYNILILKKTKQNNQIIVIKGIAELFKFLIFLNSTGTEYKEESRVCNIDTELIES